MKLKKGMAMLDLGRTHENDNKERAKFRPEREIREYELLDKEKHSRYCCEKV